MNIHINYLPERTAGLFRKFAKLSFFKKFTLVGGTALALQLEHRQSENLDFIFDGEKLPVLAIKREISKHFPGYRLIREEKDYQLDFVIKNVKATFFSSGAVLIPFKTIKYAELYQNLNIAPVEIIAVLKMATLSQRNTIRDYYDLYFIARHVMPLEEIIKRSKKMLPNISAITYTETIIYTRDLPENSIGAHLNPKERITKEQISSFFIDELKKLN